VRPARRGRPSSCRLAAAVPAAAGGNAPVCHGTFRRARAGGGACTDRRGRKHPSDVLFCHGRFRCRSGDPGPDDHLGTWSLDCGLPPALASGDGADMVLDAVACPRQNGPPRDGGGDVTGSAPGRALASMVVPPRIKKNNRGIKSDLGQQKEGASPPLGHALGAQSFLQRLGSQKLQIFDPRPCLRGDSCPSGGRTCVRRHGKLDPRRHEKLDPSLEREERPWRMLG
jgi:hypothetical protein